MKPIDILYRKRFYQWEGIALIAIIVELGGVAFILNSKFNFISGSDIVRAVISASLGLALMFTSTFAISIYKDYMTLSDSAKIDLNLELKQILNEIEQKYALMTKEYLSQKAYIEAELGRDDLKEELRKTLFEQINMIGDRLFSISIKKNDEISYAFERYSISKIENNKDQKKKIVPKT